MSKREDLKKILVIGSGPIIISQAAEFDYSGSQACLALKEEGYEVVLINSNPATIMTDKEIAENTSILYGGSCKASNAKELFANVDVDGGLIGGAALNVADFKGIIDAFN